MLVDCVSRDYADPEAVSGSSTINREEKNHPFGWLFDVNYLYKSEEPVTARKTGSSVCGVWSYILESMFVFGFCIRYLFKSYFHDNPLKCSCQ